MADEVWKLLEDGFLKLDVKCYSLIYHPNLNIILVLTKSSEVLVIDVNSGVLLQRSSLSRCSIDSNIQGVYVTGFDKVLLVNDKGIGVRSDYSGVLLLDTILQTPITKPDEVVKLELPLSEAVMLQQTLRNVELPGVEKTSEVLDELTEKIKEAQARPKRGLKTQKWNCVCLELGHCALKWVCAGIVSELKRLNRHVPSLTIASALNERLNSLLPPPLDGTPPDRSLMFSEAMRRQTFANWPHMNYKWALPDQMAQAGFYHQPNTAGDDRAMCFTCIVCLVCWEPTDEPWSEHERHSPSCPFVKGEYTQNVPLSVTYATAPAVPTPQPIILIGTSSVPELIPTATSSGLIQVWNCSRQLKSEASFLLGYDIRKNPQEAREAWADQDIVEIPLLDSTFDNLMKTTTSCNQDVKLGAVSIVGPCKKSRNETSQDEDDCISRQNMLRPALITGVCVTNKKRRTGVSPLVRAKNDVNQPSCDNIDIMKVMEQQNSCEKQLFLVVYDFHYNISRDSIHRSSGGNTRGISGGTSNGVGGNNVGGSSEIGGVGSVTGSGGGGQSGGATKKLVSGTGTSASRQDNNIQDIFLSKFFYCQGSLMDDVDITPPPDCHFDNLPPFQGTQDIVSGLPSYATPSVLVMPTVGGGTFDTSISISDTLQFPSTSNSSPPNVNKLLHRDLKGDNVNGFLNGVENIAPREPVSEQCIAINTYGRDVMISGLYPTKDGNHLLVAIKSVEEERTKGGLLILYSLAYDRPVISLKETYLHLRELEENPSEIVLLPIIDREESDEGAACPLGVAVLITDNGNIHLINVATLETIAIASPQDGSKFITATYCNSLERLCVATDTGTLHFFALRDEEEKKKAESIMSSSQDQSFLSTSPSIAKESLEQLLVNESVLGLNELKLLYELTQFENLSPCYAATVPACWTELMQAQKQRRHPQHLQHADDIHHTRSWRLQNDATTWDEHVFEITLPRSVCIGHVDVKFSLHSQCPTPPRIEMTLLKQNATGIGRTKEKFNEYTLVDSTVDFNLSSDPSSTKKGAVENPVTNEEFLRAHNMEVLCGPISLSSCLDLTEQAGTITFSSLKLFRMRGRTLLVHMKALSDPASGTNKKAKSEGLSWEVQGMSSGTPDSFVERLTNATKKTEYIGCDWLHEVSITIRKTKQTDIANERLERFAMLESSSFLERLLKVVCKQRESGDKGQVNQCIALDILNWIAAIRLGRLRCSHSSLVNMQVDFIKIVESYLPLLIKQCFIQGGRSVAQKCVKLFTLCSDGMRNLENSTDVDFNQSLIEAFLEGLNSVLQSWSAGAMRWYFHCLARMITVNPSSVAKASYKALMLLRQVASHLNKRQNPNHLLLRSRFGLYGTPFEAELFDVEPPVPAKFSSMPVTYASLVAAQDVNWSNSAPNVTSPFFSGVSAEPIDLRELLPIFGNGNNQSESGKPNLFNNLARLKGLTSNLYMKGLLEVEPLHFTCHSTSDGTKLEKMESCGVNNPWVGLYEAQPMQITTSDAAKKTSNEYEDYEFDYEPREEMGKIKMKKLKEVLANIKEVKEMAKIHFHDDENIVYPKEKISATSASTGTSTSTSSSYTNRNVSYSKEGTISWQQLLMAPAQQMLVIERMHSGARRFVVLDLGAPVLLTDLLIPACPELLSLSIDIWTRAEEVDAQRLVVASDIGTKTLVMSDIQPPPICQFIKITTIGRYGMNTTKCRIPVGSFYGHILVLPGEDYAEKNSHIQNISEENIQNQIGVLSALFEDVQCRYSLACSKLENLLAPLLSSETPNVDHMHHYLHKNKESFNNQEAQKITSAYRECVTYQHQLNVVRSVMRRLGAKMQPVSSDLQQNLVAACTDKLRVLGESLTDLLLYIVYGVGLEPGIDSTHLHQMVDQSMCERLFHWICVGDDIRMQVSCCTLLVRLCGLQPWWGSFLVNTISQLYSSQQNNIFPQDRVFILLIYLCRKSLSGGASRSVVMDSVLKTILQLLEPLGHSLDSESDAAAGPSSTNNISAGFLCSRMDLPLISWLLLFLSQCLDSQPNFYLFDDMPDKIKNCRSNGPLSRWDFLQGEMAMQRRTYLTSRCTASRNYRRKLQKKLMHHKQQLEDIESAKKAFHATQTKEPSAASSSSSSSSSYRASNRASGCETDGNKHSNSASLKDSDCCTLALPRAHCLPVARALVKLILQMDITCNVDLFLLACKVVARVAVWTRPTVSLGEIFTQEQLVTLLRLVVRSAWGSPWVSHTITCLLQDILQGVSSKPSSPVDQTDSKPETKEADEATSMNEDNSPPGPSSGKNGENFPLPSLLESDDSELEDLLEDILERGCSLIKKSSSRMAVGAVSSISTALDSRLEYSVENNVAVNLRRITAQAAYNLPLCINASISQKGVAHEGPLINHWEDSLTECWPQPYHGPAANGQPCSFGFPTSIEMLTNAFNFLFNQLMAQVGGCNFEAVVHLWLTLSSESDNTGVGVRSFDPSVIPLIPLAPSAFSALMFTLVRRGGISVREWCLAFQALTLLANLPLLQGISSPENIIFSTLCGMAPLIVSDANFVPMLHSFLSSPQIKGCAGVPVCQCLHELLVRLEMRCDVISGSSDIGNKLKESLLKLVYQLVQEGGAIAARHGPLDAQAHLIQMLIHLSFPAIDLSTAIGILQSVGVLVEGYMLNSEGVKGRGVSDVINNSNGSMSFSTSTFLPSPSWEHLLIVLLRLVTNIVQTPLHRPDNNSYTLPVSQTDEHKAAHNTPEAVKLPCVADIVLQHELTMSQLLGALGGCVRSTFSVHHTSGVHEPSTCCDVPSDPSSVGDALFLLLATLARKATHPKLILRPLFTYLSSNGLSEPLQWLVLQVLQSEDALRVLDDMGGVRVICSNLVESSGHLISSQPSTVSVVMQHLSQIPNCAPLTHVSQHKKNSNNSNSNNNNSNSNNNNNNNNSNSGGSSSSSSTTNLEVHDTLINFAPLGVICSSNPTAPPADVLIQSAPPHRRARTPAWSYHFYPEESWVELTITLPCAVLLRAVHIQPHLTSLSTCPSGVSLEIGRDGRGGLVPVGPPFNTSGLTFVRLTLPQPEVVTSVLLRLYKPRDSATIGLSQIRLLGTTTFGETDLPDARKSGRNTQSSLGWLRLLHHCITMPTEPGLKASMLVAAADMGQTLLQSLCSLLLVASSPVTSCLETVLLTLGLHHSSLGLQIISILLNNGGSLTGAMNSVVDLLYNLGTTEDADTKERLSAIIDWLYQNALRLLRPCAAYVHCVASILWTCHESKINCDLASLITPDLFSIVYEWTLELSSRSCLKSAIDSVLCSICFIEPVFFPTLLQRMSILVPICTSSPQASISDDRKDHESSSQTDDSKKQECDLEREMDTEWYNGLVLQDLQQLALSEGQIMTVAMVCQSPPATRHLLDSGLPSLLTLALLGFCLQKYPLEKNKEHANQSRMTDAEKTSGRNHVLSRVNAGKSVMCAETMAVILKFLAEVCMEGEMRDWLGSPEGSLFWAPLLTMLCNKPQDDDRCEMMNDMLYKLESATVKFLSRCCWCHPNNQKLLSKVLCDVICRHKTSNNTGSTNQNSGISGVTRRMILQILLESEKIFVSVQGAHNNPGGHNSPALSSRRTSRLLYLSVHTTCNDILKTVTAMSTNDQKAGENSEAKDVRSNAHFLWEANETLAVAAGVTAKDKRLKDTRLKDAVAMMRGPYGKKPRTNVPDTQMIPNANSVSQSNSSCLPSSRLTLHHAALPEGALPGNLTLGQLLSILQDHGISLSTPCITLTVKQTPNLTNNSSNAPTANSSSSKDTSNENVEILEDLLSAQSLPTALQVFTQQGGLALLAQHLPPVYPETLLHFGIPDRTSSLGLASDQTDSEGWVKVEVTDDIYEDLDYVCVGVQGQGTSTVGPGKRSTASDFMNSPTIPVHSLAAFGLFLRLPGYAEVLLRDKRKAQCLLRLTLGVTDDGEGGDILTCPVASSLPTLPFEVLRQLLESTPLTTDDGVLLRRTGLETGALHLLLACLAIFTHFPQDLPLPGNNQQVVVTAVSKSSVSNEKQTKPDDKSHLYWAKGTGFGTGSTAQSWNVEQALSRQRIEEEHVTVLLQVLSSYINPGGLLPPGFLTEEGDDDSDSMEVEGDADHVPPPLPSVFPELLQQSCLLPALSSYLRNDSVLDMARHIPLYRAVLQLLRAMAQNTQLVSLLLPQKASVSANDLSIVCLLTKMKSCVDTYAHRLKNNKVKGHRKNSRTGGNCSSNSGNNSNNNNSNKMQEEMESDEGLALLIPDIQETAYLVQVATDRLTYDGDTDGESTSHAEVDYPMKRSLDERYLEVMKALQFDTYEMITENSDGSGYQFVVSYHFESNVKSGGERCHPSRMKRLAQETVTLSTSLPLSYSSSVFVRCDTDRLDIMKVLITGPAETPYANGCFELDVYFPPDYPNSPMLINLETTGHHTIRFNPNLYNDGKVCLSVLNTWHGRPEEKWNAHTSSFLQVLVSIQSLILVPEPYFNEPGYERSRGTPSGDQSSREYNSNICQATVKWAMLEQLRNPSPCFKQVIQTHFWMKRKEIKKQIEGWIADMESQSGDRRTGRTISLNTIALKRHYHQLCDELNKLKAPPGLEDLADPEPLSPAPSAPVSAWPQQETSPSVDLETEIQMEKLVSEVCES
ncbi:BIR repeat containing ubiquitin-conjugating enzyme isoform X2 [Lycorma delicatula]|uniref:BIR repeat containing ubiquitin-conjugating enzyme isoform X2 n=1 Tax=Lycorma delicatula TaxID=130591 RepID=UPI003F51110A